MRYRQADPRRRLRLRRRLATALRPLREERDLNCTEAGKVVAWSESKISWIETGQVKIA